MAKELLSFSDCGLYYNYFDSDGNLKIWDTSEGVLKQKYVPHLHLKGTCTAGQWISTLDNNAVHRKKKKREENHDKTLALGTTDGSVALYSVAEGKIISLLEEGHTTAITALCWSTKLGLFSSSKNEVVWWDIGNKKVKRKWKCGKGKITSLAVSNSGEFCVTGASSLQLWRFENDQIILLRTYTGHDSEVTNIVFVNDQYFLSSALEDQHISVWSTKSDYEEPLGRFGLSECLHGNISVFENNGTVHLCAITKNGNLNYFKHQLNGKVGKTIKSHEIIQISTEDNAINSIPIVSAQIISEATTCIVYGHPPSFHFESIEFSETKKKRTCLIRNSCNNYNKHKEDNGVTVAIENDNTDYVGSSPRRRSRNENVSTDEHLGKLSLRKKLVTERFNPNDLSILLTKGLESNDSSLLESLVHNKDIGVINETVSNLPVTTLDPLVGHLKTMLLGDLDSSEVGCMWLRAVVRLRSGEFVENTDSSSSPLYSVTPVIDSRLADITSLRDVFGKLEHIVSQLDETLYLGITNNQSILVYQDEESSDDEESLWHDDGSETEDDKVSLNGQFEDMDSS